MLSIEKEPKKKVFKELLDYCFQICDEFQLVIRTDMGCDNSDLRKIVKKFNDSFKGMKKQSKWASNTLGDGHKAEVYYFKADESAKNVILNLSDSLYEWESPSLPEDLSFFVNGKVWMATSSHEKECYIYPFDEKQELALQKIKGLKLEEVED